MGDDRNGSQGLRGGFPAFATVWAGQLLSQLGSGLTSFGVAVWLYDRTKSATPFAIAFLIAVLPGIILAPVAGHVADRFDRRKVIILAILGDTIATLLALALILTGRLEPWAVYIIIALSSSCQTFHGPAWSAAVPSLVPRELLGRANGLESVQGALVSLLPPALAGLLFGFIGLGGLVTIDLVSYAFAFAGLALVRIPRIKAVESPAAAGDGGSASAVDKPSILRDALFGFRYLAERKGLLGLTFYFAFVNFCLNFAMVLLPPMVLPALGSAGLGFAQSSLGLGALVGGLAAAVWGGPKRSKVGFVVACLGLSSLGVLAAGLRPSLAFVAGGLFFLLFAIQVGSATMQTIFQTKIEGGAMGRTRAARSMLSMSLMPIAALAAGPLADRVFGPALMPGGWLATGRIADLLGTGQGRGVGFMFVLAALALFTVTCVVYLSPRIRRLEELLPDAPAPAPEASMATLAAAGAVVVPTGPGE